MFILTRRLQENIRTAMDRIGLDLSGLTVMTEIGYGPYNVTPLLAGIAGARKVYCMTRPMGGYSSEDILSNFSSNLNLCGGDPSVYETFEGRPGPDAVRQTDVFTNLGALRPFDRDFIRRMRSGAAISTMFEKWEFREEDIDLSACTEFGVKVAGTNENNPALDVFSYTGHLGLKLLFEAGCVVLNSRVLIVSPDHFGEKMFERLTMAGAQPTYHRRWTMEGVDVHQYDAVYAANFTDDTVLYLSEGEMGYIRENRIPFVHVCGRIGCPSHLDLTDVLHPRKAPRAKFMTETLAYLGPEPVLYLNLLGLKAGASAFLDSESPFSQPINFQWG